MPIWTPESKQNTTWIPKSKDDRTWTPEGDIKEIIFDNSYNDSKNYTKIILNATSSITLKVKSLNFVGSIWTAV